MTKRLSFTEEEEKLPWLANLLESLHIIDEGVSAAVQQKEEEEKRKLACRAGCDSCCRTQRDIPVYPHELVGIYWYAMEKLKQPTRAVLQQRLLRHDPRDACPFLMETRCAVHPLRPTACRQFNVFGEPCAEGEDPYHTRRDDVLTPLREYTHRAFAQVFPFYGVTEEKDRTEETIVRIIQTQITNLHTYDWRKLSGRMGGA